MAEQLSFPGMGGESVPTSRMPKGAIASIGMPYHVLAEASRTGKFKNAFETSRDPVGFEADMYDQRKDAENLTSGVPLDAPSEARPIYGFLRRSNVNPAENPKYGDAMIDLEDPKVGQNITALYGDSWRKMAGEDNEHSDHLPNYGMDPHQLSSKTDVAPSEAHPHDDYTELQFLDRPTPRNITDVHLFEDKSAPSFEARTQELRNAGVTAPIHRWERRSAYQPSLWEGDQSVGPQFNQGETRNWWQSV